MRAITTYDVRWACDVLRAADDGRPAVSTAGCPSRSTRARPATPQATVAEARALWWLVDRPNLFVKIPATLEGCPRSPQASPRASASTSR